MAQTLYGVGTETKVPQGGGSVLTALPDGGWVAVWSQDDGSGFYYNLYQQRYDQTGILSYDKDGSGKAKAIAFAKLPKHLTMKHDEFFII